MSQKLWSFPKEWPLNLLVLLLSQTGFLSLQIYFADLFVDLVDSLCSQLYDVAFGCIKMHFLGCKWFTSLCKSKSNLPLLFTTPQRFAAGKKLYQQKIHNVVLLWTKIQNNVGLSSCFDLRLKRDQFSFLLINIYILNPSLVCILQGSS